MSIIVLASAPTKVEASPDPHSETGSRTALAMAVCRVSSKPGRYWPHKVCGPNRDVLK